MNSETGFSWILSTWQDSTGRSWRSLERTWVRKVRDIKLDSKFFCQRTRYQYKIDIINKTILKEWIFIKS